MRGALRDIAIKERKINNINIKIIPFIIYFCKKAASVSRALAYLVKVQRDILKQELNGTKPYKETSTDEKTVVNSHSNNLPYKFAVNVKERQDKLPTMYWLV